MTTTTSNPQEQQQPTLHLHTYFRSSCSARLRIALRLKHLPFTATPVHLLRGEQTSPIYTSLNPSGTVPTLTHNDDDKKVTITQSVPALEYLDEAFPHTRPLYPADPALRAAVRTLVSVVACDVQPLTNAKTMKAVNALEGGDGAAWSREWTTRGLDAFERMLGKVQGEEDEATVCVPEVGVSAADVCLVPAV